MIFLIIFTFGTKIEFSEQFLLAFYRNLTEHIIADKFTQPDTLITLYIFAIPLLKTSKLCLPIFHTIKMI